MPNRLLPFLLPLLAFLTVNPLTEAMLTQEVSEQRTVFLPADFEQYAPITALDMIDRIPGFKRNEGGGNQRRGLGQASANVLINGQRIASKSASVGEFLRRIPAKSVERIELLDGTKLDIPGLTGLVANVISNQNGISGTWAFRPSFRREFDPNFKGGEFSMSGENADLGWTIGLSAGKRGSTGQGEELLHNSTGAIIEDSAISERFSSPGWSMNAGVQWMPPSGIVANLNVDYDDSEFEFFEKSRRVPTSGSVENRRIDRSGKTKTAELSGDIEYGLGEGRLKLIGVYLNRERPFNNSVVKRNPANRIFDESHLKRLNDESETILRGEYNWSAFGGTLDWSLESAINTLESTFVVLEGDGTTDPIPTTDGESFVKVEESRSETILTYSRALSDNVQLQVSLGTEISDLSSSGPNGQTRSFARPKGGISLSWTASQNAILNARIDRQVGQLNFFDFVSRVDLDNGEDQVGNSNIVPEQRWRGEVELEQNYGAWGAGSIRLYGAALEDIVDQIPIGDSEGPGNIDSGYRIGTEVEGTLNLDQLGLLGVQLTYTASLQNSEVDDPLTSKSRAINNDSLAAIDLEFRHDIEGSDFAWGGRLQNRKRAEIYRLSSIRSERRLPGRYRFYVEHKNLWGLAGKIEIVRPFNEVEKYKRIVYGSNRTGSINEIETSRVEGKPIFVLELTGTF